MARQLGATEGPWNLKKMVLLGVLWGHFGDSFVRNSNSNFNPTTVEEIPTTPDNTQDHFS